MSASSPVLAATFSRVYAFFVSGESWNGYAATDYSSMRARDLKRHLLRLGVQEAAVNGLLDKADLIALADAFMHQQKELEHQVRIVGVVLLIGVILWLYRIRHHIYNFIVGCVEWLKSYFYPIQLKIPSLRYAWRKRLLLAGAYLLLSIVIDLYISYVQLSVLSSWILPADSTINRFSARVPSMSVSPASLLAAQSGNATDSNSFSLNVGPVIALWVCRYTKSHLESVAAEIIMTSKLNSKRS
jgi:hypothetical protein